ncbi:hypothetical protein JHK84_028068 [Glycine max]|nr:hypothetical protein JHK85_028484 [Glycine max]KAG5003815.1 hypothetical protein JHK86_027954 [Glycine max]KAG5151596.1 hypothetical protein JHK84_028068 [Glycine max]
MPSAPSKLYASSLHSLNPLFTIYAGSDVWGDDDIKAEGVECSEAYARGFARGCLATPNSSLILEMDIIAYHLYVYCLIGDVIAANSSHREFFHVWKTYGVLPERILANRKFFCPIKGDEDSLHNFVEEGAEA